ncbi:hypothetical protein [Mastigocoleus sp. MO_188.B34]|uniref:hypothetical protein n=1 Tax=Mastigocoleus sp. MO_188.B34 TaxID=3036635 RepID=UPI00261EFDBE|nr:hypothetical protein [Mastigocoleus sp. MO_188.B34]MDJ0696028.1 hypothetical protein [Mastigocoleus sp. MO_188.B34]
MLSHDSTNSLKEADKAELNKLVSVLEISSSTTIIGRAVNASILMSYLNLHIL